MMVGYWSCVGLVTPVASDVLQVFDILSVSPYLSVLSCPFECNESRLWSTLPQDITSAPSLLVF